jgi:glutamate synthase (NADPH/NADH) small chain
MAIINTPRVKMNEQDAHERVHNFEEVNCGLTLEQAKAEAERCLNCKNPRCVQGCPVNVNIPKFIGYVKEGELDKAYEAITATNNLPAVCGRVCPQEEQCEKLCIRGPKLGGPVAIGYLERFVADYALKKESTVKQAEKKNYRVAVVGSGPAGLTCAADCAAAGMDVTNLKHSIRRAACLYTEYLNSDSPRPLLPRK